MLKLCRVTKVNMFFSVLVYVFNFDLFEFLAAILEKGLLSSATFDVQDAGGRSRGGLVGSVKPPKWDKKLLMCAIFDNNLCGQTSLTNLIFYLEKGKNNTDGQESFPVLVLNALLQ